jgi:hypothetical protein
MDTSLESGRLGSFATARLLARPVATDPPRRGRKTRGDVVARSCAGSVRGRPCDGGPRAAVARRCGGDAMMTFLIRPAPVAGTVA